LGKLAKTKAGREVYSIFPNTFQPEVMEKFIQANPSRLVKGLETIFFIHILGFSM